MVKTLDGDEILDHLEYELGSLAISFLASLEKLNLMTTLPVRRAEETGEWNKWDNKEIGGASLQFATFLHESGILGLAKIIEDTFALLNKNFNANLKFTAIWNDNVTVSHEREFKTVLALNNIIKHQASDLTRPAKPRAGDNVCFILDEWSVASGWDLETIIHSKHDMFCVVSHIPKIYIALCGLIEKHAGAKSFIDLNHWETAGTKLFEYLIPDMIGVERPRFT